MSEIILVTGGARSGKSTHAEGLAKDRGKKITYIATAKAIDKDMEDRIKKHKNQRPKEWSTIEKYRDFKELELYNEFSNSDTILIDCITIMVTNLLFEDNIDFDNCDIVVIEEIEKKIFYEIDRLINIIKKNNKRAIIVTNEVGMGLVPSYRLGSIFRDIAGRVNQYLAKKSTEVYFTVSGIPIKIK